MKVIVIGEGYIKTGTYFLKIVLIVAQPVSKVYNFKPRYIVLLNKSRYLYTTRIFVLSYHIQKSFQ